MSHAAREPRSLKPLAIGGMPRPALVEQEFLGTADCSSEITDGRFSGGSSGLSIGHVSPEVAEGGTTGLVEAGDMVTIDIPNRFIRLEVSDEELVRSRTGGCSRAEQASARSELGNPSDVLGESLCWYESDQLERLELAPRSVEENHRWRPEAPEAQEQRFVVLAVLGHVDVKECER